MRQFLQAYEKYLLYLPVAAVLTGIGFLVGKRAATRRQAAARPGEPVPKWSRAPLPAGIQVSIPPARRLPEPVEQNPPAVPARRWLNWIGLMVLLIPFAIAVVAIALSSGTHLQTRAPQPVPGGDPVRGRQAIANFGCGACHTISGIPGANGKVGPELNASLAQRSLIAGKLANTPDNLITWIVNPQGITPGTGMPNLNIPEQSARDIAAYLYSLH